MYRKILLFCLVLICLTIRPGAVLAGPVTVTVAEQATVRGPVITLGELAQISGADDELARQLEQLTLGSAPPPGGSLVLTDRLLAMRAGAANARYADVIWQIPDKITVTTGAQSVHSSTLTAAVIAVIQDKIGSSVSADDLDIVPAAGVPDITVPLGPVEVLVDLPYGIRYSTPTVARISILVDNQLYTRRNASFSVKYYQLVVVADKLVEKRQILLPGDLRYERMDTSKLASGYFTDIAKVVGLMIRRPLTPGTVVNGHILEKPVVIRRGSYISIVARVGEIEVRTAGQALQDGSEGDMIRVQNLTSKKIISARVLDTTAVQVLTFNGG